MTNITEILDRVYNADKPAKEDLVHLLSLTDDVERQQLFDYADKVRKEYIGDGVLLRGIIEISNECDNTCLYCGLNKYNKQLNRYRMTYDEIMKSSKMIADAGIRTIVIQAGESETFTVDEITKVVKGIKEIEANMAITLSLGEYDDDAYAIWREAGADRYLLKQEIIDAAAYKNLHPDMEQSKRLNCLKELRKLDYQVGSGVLIGIPGQTIEILAEDILFFKESNFDMIGVGPFIPHSQTELKDAKRGDVDMTINVVAVTRIVTKNAHLPATTALGSVEEGDLRLDALKAGANVLMPNFTPAKYKAQYEIYPNKRCIDEPTGACALCMAGLVKSIGRSVDFARGDSLKK